MDKAIEVMQASIRKEGYRIAEETGDPDPRWWSEALAQAALDALTANGFAVVPVGDLEMLLQMASLVTVRQVVNAGEAAIDAAGLNPWCINEGLAEGHEKALAGWKISDIRAMLKAAQENAE